MTSTLKNKLTSHFVMFVFRVSNREIKLRQNKSNNNNQQQKNKKLTNQEEENIVKLFV